MSIRALVLAPLAALAAACAAVPADQPNASAQAESARVILLASPRFAAFSGDASLGGAAMVVPVEVYSAADVAACRTADSDVDQACLSERSRRRTIIAPVEETSVVVALGDEIAAELFSGQYATISVAPGPLAFQLRERRWRGREPYRADDWVSGPHDIVATPGETYYVDVTSRMVLSEDQAREMLESYTRVTGRL
ncbi:MAG: hypothetical protein PVI23_11135 [Maricaulaceae bacterium]|jgi:hypothetical protein